MRTIRTLLLAIALTLAACAEKHTSPAASSDDDATQVAESPAIAEASDEAFDGFVASEDPRLGERVSDPTEDLASDEEDLPAGEEDEYLFGTNFPNTPVQFAFESSTSLLATAEQRDFEQAMLMHNASLIEEAGEQSEQEPTAADPQASVNENGANKSADSTAAQTPTETQNAKDNKPAVVDEKAILADPHGQWAMSAKASSTYAQSPADKAGYSAWQATAAPNVSRYSDNPASWTAKAGDGKDPEWLQLEFAKSVHASAVRVRQNAGPGAIAQLELIDGHGQAHEIWSGTDDTAYEKNTIGWFIREFPATDYPVAGVRITLMTARVWGWNEIDAVQLVGEP